MIKINVEYMRIAFNYDDNGKLIEIILFDEDDDYDVLESWLYD